MQFNDLISDSCFTTIDTIGARSLADVRTMILLNAPVISLFPIKYIITNDIFGISQVLKDDYIKLWKELIPTIIHVDIGRNLGHGFGTMELDNACILFGKSSNKKYTWKSSCDYMITLDFLKVHTTDADIWCMPSCSYYSLLTGYGDLVQTTFFILKNKEHIPPCIYNVDLLQHMYNVSEQYPGVPHWELPFNHERLNKYDCETQLYDYIHFNNLTPVRMINDETNNKLRSVIKRLQIGDPSHKHLYFSEYGLCHVQDTGADLIII